MSKIDEQIKESLRACSLEKVDIEKCLPFLRKTSNFINARQLAKNSPFWNFNSKIAQTAKFLDINKKDFMSAALKFPQLFYQTPKTIDDNVTQVASLLKIDKTDYIKIALKRPQLFSRKPETVDKNISQTAKLLGIDKDFFIKVALKQPPLFSRKPETINSNITKVANLLHINKNCYVKAALKKPSLFYQKFETIIGNITQAATLLGIDKDIYIKAALKQPQLFYQKPETINSNITRTAKLLDIDKDCYISTALMQPSLFYLNPNTVYHHACLMKEFNNQNIIIPNVQRNYLNKPNLLCLSNDNFKLRLTFAKHTNIKNQNSFALLRQSRKEIERKMIEILGFSSDKKVIFPNSNNENLELLKEMIADKRIKGYSLDL